MDHQDTDWLDARMSSMAYIPDDGFAAQVVSRLPKTRPATVSPRKYILSASVIIAAGMLILHLVGLVRNVNHTAANIPWVHVVNQGLNVLQEPTVLIGAAVLVVMAGFALIPFLQRWV